MDSSARRPIEHALIGSREITGGEKDRFLKSLLDTSSRFPKRLETYLRDLARRIESASVGFRRENMPALLVRFFSDMDKVLQNCAKVLRKDGEAMVVIGDNRTRVRKTFERIPTTDFVEELAETHGLRLRERIDISVTTENLLHIKNAITKNAVLRLARS
jgi:DNA-binding transcriptional regulator YbjK